MSKRLYENKANVKSGLVTGTQWDMMIKYLRDIGKVDIQSSNWGNYLDNTLTNLNGYYAKVDSTLSINTFKEIPNNNNTTSTALKDSSYILLTTGSTEQVKKMNLYDVAGNLQEWTQETSYYANLNYNLDNTINSYILRGGSFWASGTTYSPCSRAGNFAPCTFTMYGFRVVLYLE